MDAMETLPDIGGLREALIVLGAAALVIPLFHRLRVSPVLGFLLVGVAVGPYGLGRLVGAFPPLGLITLRHPASIAPVARFGVVLLLFMIGLELSAERLWVMRRWVFGLGAAQLLASAALLAGVAWAAGFGRQGAIVLGLAGAMSSTAIGLQVLAERKALATRFGRASFAVLLFQDLAVMPVLFAIGLLLPSHAIPGGATQGGVRALALAAGQGLAAVAAIVGLGRLALRPLLRGVARTQSPDLFMAACLLVVLGAALSAAAAHLSMALGALIGGMLLAGTEYRRAVEVTIEPFKGLGVGVFLIAVGMGLDLGRVVAQPGLVLGGCALLLGLKLAVMALAGRGAGLSGADAARAGLLLAPGGEFGLVILAQAGADGLLPSGVAASAQVVTALTMALLPLLAALGGGAARRLAAPVDPALLAPQSDQEGGAAPGVILAGYGRMGRMVGDLLDRHGVIWLGIERDVDVVTRARAAGRPVYYGDAAQILLLRRIGIAGARALVATMDNRAAIDAVVAAAHQERADLPVIARARDAGHAAHLYRLGASNAVPETIEASLQLSEAVLTDLGLPAGPVIVSIHETRAALQAEIRRAAPSAPAVAAGRRRLRDLRPGGRTDERRPG